ncbi:MAG: GNAT family N-acetyltransferase [Acidimicrobiales bacterium]|jgi:GNAT superfamily N-acetyltransferase
MSTAGPEFPIRVATPVDFARLREIEAESDEIFASVGIGPFHDDDTEQHLGAAAVVFVAGEPPVGFVTVEVVDGAAHIWQLSVTPSMQGRGLGRALVALVSDWARAQGYTAVTLTTFRDVPWNGPFYERLGFSEQDRLTSGLAAIRQHERDIGDDEFGPRIAMRMDL